MGRAPLVLQRAREHLAARGRRVGDRVPALRVAWEVQTRFGQLHGGYLSSAISLAGFLALFPLLLVGMSVVGFFSSGDPTLPSDALRVLGLRPSSDAAEIVTAAIRTAEESKAATSVVGVAGLLWSGLGVVAALQYTFDAVWQVAGRGVRDRAIGLVWLAGAGVLFSASVATTSLVALLPAVAAPVNLLATTGLAFALFLWTMKVLPNRDVGWRALVPGALVGAVGLAVLEVAGGIYVPRAVASSSAVFGAIGVVFALLAWLLFFGRLVVYASVLNVVLWEAGHGTTVIDIRVPSLPGDDTAREGIATPT